MTDGSLGQGPKDAADDNEREALPLVAMPGTDRESRVERVGAPRAGTECHVEAVGRDARLGVIALQA
jgi:hypothetical protein